MEEVKKGGKKKKSAKTAEKKPASSNKKERKEDNYLFTLIIVAVVILGIIGIVFGYTKDKISEIKKGGTEVTKGLETQVEDLKSKLAEMAEKADDLEKKSEKNKEVVLDLFDKARSIPNKINADGWQELASDELSFTVSFPAEWEVVKPIIETKDAGETQEMVYLQPIGDENFLNAITLKSDYADFASLDIDEKVDIFKELDLIDTKDFMHGTIMYFINYDKDNVEVPTMLVLTDDNIYRATFNVSDKATDNYFEYRKNFEQILSTFALDPEPDVEADGEETEE